MSERDEEIERLVENLMVARRHLFSPHRETIEDAIARLRAPVDPPEERCNCAPFHTGHYEPECPIHGEHPPERVSEQVDVTWRLYDDLGDEALTWDAPGYEQTVGWWDDGRIRVAKDVMRRLIDQANVKPVSEASALRDQEES